jgi:hypothetical protein
MKRRGRDVVVGGKGEGLLLLWLLLYLNDTVMAWTQKWRIAACGGDEAYKEDKDKGCAPQAERKSSEGAASLWPRPISISHRACW